MAEAQSMRAVKRRENLLGYLFLLPCLLFFGTFLFYPLFKSIVLSFQLTNPRGEAVAFAGLDNYASMFTSGTFLSTLKATVLFTLYTVPPGILIAFALACMTNARLPAMKSFQFIFSMPIAISAATGAVIWALLFHPSTGMLNYALGLLGISPIPWLVDPKWALISVSLMTVWMNLGFNFIVLTAGLQGISEDIYDSMKIDGAGPIRSAFSVLIPLLSPTLFFLLIVSVINAFQTFGQIHIMTKGGPMNATNVMVYQIYQEAFVNWRFGSASAQALVLFAIILLLTLLQFFWLEKKVHYQ
ncbi:sn-glycerol-3-phosphate transport system permease protein ugpA [Thermobacillus xylanilyticus]|jgi:sn-glycerol 3-phosphate transport system permease protein|uniref:Permease component of ABC-type sugar transporter n=2 Tax=Thermobacillus TaxID=76632 RepID=L0EH79_THECK|nr:MULTISPECIES: sugar ABC transporter permease [Thermobacillus]AGA59618.1 permease component of ABC-type sugar transporter [Thermobacillus composti KWC4]CAG5087456.1 sn-glycerol-3-phosphate transport system permease protein ugpA [Thermobacillus xylanilyticus]